MRIIICLLLCFAVSQATAQNLADLLTIDGPVHHDLLFGFIPTIGGGEDVLKDDSLVRHDDRDDDGTISEGDSLFWLIKISDINASGRFSVGTNEQRIVFFLAMYVGEDGALKPHPKYLYYSLPVTLRTGIDYQTFGIAASRKESSSGVKLPSILDADFNDLTAHFGEHYAWEMTIDSGSYAQLNNGIARAAFMISASTFEATWLPVDVLGFENNLISYGDCTLDIGFIGSPASVDEQLRGWTNIGYTDFVVNPDD